MAGIVLDTTVLIDHLRGYEPATQWLAGLPVVPHCSELSRVEILRGLRSAERRRAEQLLATLHWQPVTEQIARIAGEWGRRFRRSHDHIGVVDLIIAATAHHLDATLATSNVRHYPMFPGLEPPY